MSPPTIDIGRTSRRAVSALAGVAVALTVVRFAYAHRPVRTNEVTRPR